MSGHGWVGVDLDGTLAHYDGWKGEDHIGAPVAAMVERVKRWLADGRDVRIFTARVENGAAQVAGIEAWCAEHLGRVLPVTNVKDFRMVELWDDRAVGVVPNTGVPHLEAETARGHSGEVVGFFARTPDGVLHPVATLT